jgi:hypothetical protein
LVLMEQQASKVGWGWTVIAATLPASIGSCTCCVQRRACSSHATHFPASYGCKQVLTAVPGIA